MENYKQKILKRLCFTALVYQRINHKLKLDLTIEEIEKLIRETIEITPEYAFEKKGKNIYATNRNKNIVLTIHSNTCRLITADKIKTGVDA